MAGRPLRRRLLRGLAAVGAGCLVLLVIAGLGLAFLSLTGVGSERLRHEAEAAIRRAAGVDVAASIGSTSLSLDRSRFIALEIRDVRFVDAKGSEMLDAGVVRFGVRFWPLMSGQIRLGSAIDRRSAAGRRRGARPRRPGARQHARQCRRADRSRPGGGPVVRQPASRLRHHAARLDPPHQPGRRRDRAAGRRPRGEHPNRHGRARAAGRRGAVDRRHGRHRWPHRQHRGERDARQPGAAHQRAVARPVRPGADARGGLRGSARGGEPVRRAQRLGRRRGGDRRRPLPAGRQRHARRLGARPRPRRPPGRRPRNQGEPAQGQEPGRAGQPFRHHGPVPLRFPRHHGAGVGKRRRRARPPIASTSPMPMRSWRRTAPESRRSRSLPTSRAPTSRWGDGSLPIGWGSSRRAASFPAPGRSSSPTASRPASRWCSPSPRCR